MLEIAGGDGGVPLWTPSGRRARRGRWTAAVAASLVVLVGESTFANGPVLSSQLPGWIIAQSAESPSATERIVSERVPDKIDLILLGILHGAETQMAVFENRATKEQRIYKVGDSAGAGRLKTILPDRVVLTFPGGELELRLGTAVASIEPARAEGRTPIPAPAAMIAGGPSVLNRGTLLKLTQAPELLSQVEPLGDRGVRLGEVLPGDLLDALGLKSGDIIRDVNMRMPGVDRSLSAVIRDALQQQPQQAVVLRLKIERDGRQDVVYVPVGP